MENLIPPLGYRSRYPAEVHTTQIGVHEMMRYITFSIAMILVLTANAFADDESVIGKLPEEFAVYAVGTYRGTASVNVQLDDSGHAVTQVDVVVDNPEQPVVLVLTAYDPVVWRVGRTKDTKIAGILVSGYHGQALIGVDKKTPYAISSYEEKGSFQYFYASRASRRLLEMNDAVKQLVGREIEHFFNKPTDGVFYIGDPPANQEAVVYSDDLKLEGYVKKDRTVVGEEALDELVQAKKLRLATTADIAAWVDKASEKYKRFNQDLRVSTRMRVGRSYVVLDKLTLPGGLFGAHSRAFIVPDDVPFPAGPSCHNTFYKMDGTATGPGAREE